MTFFDATSNTDERIATQRRCMKLYRWYLKCNQKLLARGDFISRMTDKELMPVPQKVIKRERCSFTKKAFPFAKNKFCFVEGSGITTGFVFKAMFCNHSSSLGTSLIKFIRRFLQFSISSLQLLKPLPVLRFKALIVFFL